MIRVRGTSVGGAVLACLPTNFLLSPYCMPSPADWVLQQQLCTFYIAAGIAVDNHMTHWFGAVEPLESTLKQSKLKSTCLLTFTICLFPAPIKSLGTSLSGELRLAPHSPNPGWQAF